jgi:hypothetical protein
MKTELDYHSEVVSFGFIRLKSIYIPAAPINRTCLTVMILR